MKYMSEKEFRNEVDSLNGNINRMCITKSISELKEMRYWAKIRIDSIFQYKKQIIMEGLEND